MRQRKFKIIYLTVTCTKLKYHIMENNVLVQNMKKNKYVHNRMGHLQHSSLVLESILIFTITCNILVPLCCYYLRSNFS